MANEESLRDQLIAKFPDMAEATVVQRVRRIFTKIRVERFREVFDFAVDELKFNLFCTVTGLDEGDDLAFLYHIAREDGVVLNLRVLAPKTNPVVPTITDRFPAADISERELIDLLGATVEGLRPGKRYPLPDDWPEGQHPLRKDWKATKPADEGSPEK
jgi:Ni,Fe-hydrogenase III component G